MAAGERFKRKTIGLDVKMDVLKHFDAGEKQTDIAHAFGLSRTTVCSIIKNGARIKECAKRSARLSAVRICRARCPVLESTEKALLEWLLQRPRVNSCAVQDRARAIYAEFNGAAAGVAPFSASRGWFERFKNRHGLYYDRKTGEMTRLEPRPARRYCDEELSHEQPRPESETFSDTLPPSPDVKIEIEEMPLQGGYDSPPSPAYAPAKRARPDEPQDRESDESFQVFGKMVGDALKTIKSPKLRTLLKHKVMQEIIKFQQQDMDCDHF